MWYVIGLIWIALIVGIFWSYRAKKAKRDAESARKFEAMYGDLKLNLGASAAATVAAARPPSAEVSAAPARIGAPAYRRKPRLLEQPQAMLYLVFRTGLPDHEIFANVPLGDTVAIDDSLHGEAREQRARKLDRLRLDLVVCNKQLEVIAVVTVSRDGAPDPEHTEDTRLVEQCLSAAGVRLVRVDRKALPRHHHVRNLVYGAV